MRLPLSLLLLGAMGAVSSAQAQVTLAPVTSQVAGQATSATTETVQKQAQPQTEATKRDQAEKDRNGAATTAAPDQSQRPKAQESGK